MTAIVVCGAGPVGLAAAMMLAGDGHDVTVLEADGDPAPADPAAAWTEWERRGVAQFRQPHIFFARFRHVCDAELPGLTDRMVAAGCSWVDILATPPPSLADRSGRPEDERLRMLSGRRPVVEAVFAAAALDTPGLTVRRGARACGLVPGAGALPGVPHVAGVVLESGEELAADLVVDASGRRTRAAEWLAALGARAPHEESDDSGFVYYSRFFAGPNRPEVRGPALAPIGGISLLTLWGDRDTWSVTVFCASGDAPLKALRDADAFTRVVAACPVQAHWLDGRALTDVLPMAGVLDRYRRFVVDGNPVATGFAAVGDAWACTNPSAGRGLSVGLAHAQVVRQAVRGHLHDPAAFALAYDAATEETVTPFYRTQIAADRARLAEMDALREGRTPAPPPPAQARLLAAAMRDPDAFRGLLELIECLAQPAEVMARPAVAAAMAAADPAPRPFPGPDRAHLLSLLTG